MKMRLTAFACWALFTGAGWALGPAAQKQADRYLSILSANPGQTTAFERLWTIYAEAGETPTLTELALNRAGEMPAVSALILRRAGKDAEARAILEKASGDPAAATLYFDWLLAEGKPAEAQAALEKSGLANPALFVRLGTAWQQSGDNTKARTSWERAGALAPRDMAIRKTLADALARSGDLDAAAVQWKAIAASGTPAEKFAALEEMARAFDAAGRLPEAIAAQEALLGLMGPGHWKRSAAWQQLLALHERAGSLDELEARCQTEAAEHPRDPAAARRLAEVFAYRADDASRLVWLRKAHELLPNDVPLACEIASLEISAGRPDEAARIYDAILAVRPDDADVLFLRAGASALAGDPADAEKRIEAYLATRKDDTLMEERARDFYRRMRLSAPLERRLVRAAEANPKDEAAALDLALFHIDAGRFSEAAAVLEKLDLAGRKPKAAAETASRFAQVLHDAHMDVEAETWARRAFAAEPAAHAQFLARLLIDRGKSEEAIQVMLDAGAASGDALPAEELDRACFLAIQAQDAKPGALRLNGETRKTVASIRQAAEASSAEGPWLRLARWLRWSGDPAGAVAALRHSAKMIPSSVPLREALASALADSGDPDGAMGALHELVAAHPDRAAEFQRRMGHLALDGGRPEEGLRLFRSLAESQPGDWRITADLALAEQVNGNWFQALEMWRKAFSLAPADSRRAMRQPILNAAARLQMPDSVLDVLEELCAQERGDARDSALREAAAYAVQNKVADPWRQRLQARAAAGDSSWKLGLAYILKSEGRDREGDRVLADIRRGATETPASLEPLIKAAEDGENWAEAARLARRLANLGKEPDAALSQRLAFLLERAGEFDEARRTWNAVAARHARDPGALAAAADYFSRVGDENRRDQCLEAAAKLAGCSPQVYLLLGRSALERGDRAAAVAHFESVLSVTRPDPAAIAGVLPLPATLAKTWPAPRLDPSQPAPDPGATPIRPTEKGPAGSRLLAIEALGGLLANSPQKKEWLARFSTPVERVWAFTSAGEYPAALAELARLNDEAGPTASHDHILALFALESGDAEFLKKWTAADASKASARWDVVNAALAALVDAGWRPGPDVLPRVFASAPAIKRWQAARTVAARGDLESALALGAGVPADLPGNDAAVTWLGLARWNMARRDSATALQNLDRSLAAATPSVSYTDVFFASLRTRWLITPPAERAEFEASVNRRLRDDPGARAAAKGFFAALRGDSAEKHMAELFEALRTTPGPQWAELVQQGGARLEEWGLPQFARALYRNELARDPASRLMNEEDFRRQTENLLAANQIFFSRPESIPYFVNEWLARDATSEELIQCATRLQQAGRMDAAGAVVRTLSDSSRRDEMAALGLLTFTDNPFATETLASWMERLPAGYQSRPPFQNAAFRLSERLEELRQDERALALLAKFRPDGPALRLPVFQEARLLAKLGRHREAIALLESRAGVAPAVPGSRLLLADLYAGFGREREASSLLEAEIRSGSPERHAAETALRDLARQSGDSSRLSAAGISPVPKGNNGAPAPANEPAKALARLDRPPVTEPARFRAGRDFLVARDDLPDDLRAAELNRLTRLAARDATLLPELYVLRKNLALRDKTMPELEAGLLREWKSGDYYAGEILIQIYLEQNRAADLGVVFDEFLTDRYFNERAWEEIGRRLLAAEQPALAARVLAALTTRAPGDQARTLRLAEALWKSGRTAEARALVDSIERVAAADPQWALDLARFEIAIGSPDRAKPVLLAASMQPAAARRVPALWMSAAAGFVKQGSLDEARDALVRAAADPAALTISVLADYYAARGDLASLAPADIDLPLPPATLDLLRLAIAERLATAEGSPERVWAWIEAGDPAIGDARWRKLAINAEATAPDRAEAFWQRASADGTRWAARAEAAEFFLRRARAEPRPAAALKFYERAHNLQPGSFAVAQAYAAALRQSGKPEAARKVFESAVRAFATPADRRAIREQLNSPALPNDPGV